MFRLLPVICASMAFFFLPSCSQRMGSVESVFDSVEEDREEPVFSETNGDTQKTVDLKVKMAWARAEQYKVTGDSGHNRLFGIVRTELVSNTSQTVIVHYSTNGLDWDRVTAKNNGLTDDGVFSKHYFYTPLILADTNQTGPIDYQFKIEYRREGETNIFSDEGKTFRACARPRQDLPDGVVGQGSPGYWHILLENAEVQPVFDTGGKVSNYLLHGHIQVKNEGVELDKIVKVIYRTNTTGWTEENVHKYPCGYAFRTGKIFYPNNYRYRMDHWEFDIPLSVNTELVQFILQVEYPGTNWIWSDKNRCRRYVIKSIPGIMTSFTTN